MARNRSRTSGLVTTLASLVLVVGAALLSISEGQVALIPTSIPYPTLPVYDYSFPETATLNQFPGILPSLTPSQANACPPPSGWFPYRVQAGDTLQNLTLSFPATVAEIVAANCLVVDTLPPSSIIFLPPVAATGTSTPVATQQVCGPPTNWVPYLVQLNDSLLKISLMFNISVPELQLANCMGDSTTIYVGTYIMVPFLPTKTFTPTYTPTFTAETLPPQFTNTPVFTLTLTPTTENTPTWTYTPTLVLTVTPSETLTPLPTNTETIQPTPTENPIVTPEG